MSEVNSNQSCHCECGDTQFTIKGKPLTRIFCHCTICQEFNSADFSDVTIFLSKDVEFDHTQNIDFRKYKSPPAVDRGKCGTCHKPVIELLNLPLFPSFTIIPSANIAPGRYLPEAAAHIFYHRRVNEVDDNLPKYSGFMRSQISLVKKLLAGMASRRKSA